MGSGAVAGAGSQSSPTEGKTPLCCRKRVGRTPGALYEESLYSLQEAPVGHLPPPSTRGQELGNWGPTGT